MGIGPQFAYYRLGTEQGGNIGLWRFAIRLQADRIRESIEMERGATGDLRDEATWRLDADAHFLLVAVRNGPRLVDQLQQHVADPRLATALIDFAARFRDAHDFRDVLTHIDEYIQDRGRLQRKGSVDPGSSSYRMTTKDGEIVYGFGPFVVPLLATAEAAGDVMALADAAWLQGFRDNVDQLDGPDRDRWARRAHGRLGRPWPRPHRERAARVRICGWRRAAPARIIRSRRARTGAGVTPQGVS